MAVTALWVLSVHSPVPVVLLGSHAAPKEAGGRQKKRMDIKPVFLGYLVSHCCLRFTTPHACSSYLLQKRLSLMPLPTPSQLFYLTASILSIIYHNTILLVWGTGVCYPPPSSARGIKQAHPVLPCSSGDLSHGRCSHCQYPADLSIPGTSTLQVVCGLQGCNPGLQGCNQGCRDFCLQG